MGRTGIAIAVLFTALLPLAAVAQDRSEVVLVLASSATTSIGVALAAPPASQLAELDTATRKAFVRGRGALVPAAVAEGLDIKIGDSVTVIEPVGYETPFGQRPAHGVYDVLAIWQPGPDVEPDFTVYLAPEAIDALLTGAN